MVMRKCLLSSAALVGLLSAPAMAADIPARMPVKAPPPATAVAFSWTGCYIGAQVGYQWGKDREQQFFNPTGALFQEIHFNSKGVVGGGHVGCNWQSNAFVFGLEADVEGSGVRGDFRFANGDGNDFRSTVQGSVRGRLGWAFNQTLLYVTGGLAWAHLEYVDIDAVPGARESHKFNRAGWTVGAGVEQALSANWSVRGEYRFTDYGKVSYDLVVVAPGFRFTHEPEFHAVRGYLTYRWGGPVVARY